MSDLQQYFERIPFNKDVKFDKRNLPFLPSCFKPTILGEYRGGVLGQYRCGSLHAYDFGDHWLIHKDHRNPETQPWEHLVEDAPHVLVGAAIVIGGALLGHALSSFFSDSEYDE